MVGKSLVGVGSVALSECDFKKGHLLFFNLVRIIPIVREPFTLNPRSRAQPSSSRLEIDTREKEIVELK